MVIVSTSACYRAITHTIIHDSLFIFFFAIAMTVNACKKEALLAWLDFPAMNLMNYRIRRNSMFREMVSKTQYTTDS